MPRAEIGSTKQIANQMKSKGLQRLRWYCQACQRQMRDENGFKCHVASESHVRNMMVIGEDPRKAINDYSNQFQRDFIQLLRTGHGEKKVNVNHFYQEYIGNKQHVHMNSTKWASLTEFAKHLGREGICRVEADEKDDGRGGAGGLMIGWIDNSPDALRRQDALKKKERQDRGDEEREQRAIQEQIRRAKRDGISEDMIEEEDDDDDDEEVDEGPAEGLKRKEGEKIVLNFAPKKHIEAEKPPSPPLTDKGESPDKDSQSPVSQTLLKEEATVPVQAETPSQISKPTAAKSPGPVSKTSLIPIAFAPNKPKNVFAAASKKNPLSGTKKPGTNAPSKPISEAERIMKEEIDRKRLREANGSGFKRQRLV